MKDLKGRALRFVLLYGAWLVLTDPGKRDEWIAGGIVALLAAALPLFPRTVLGDLKLSPKALVGMIVYFAVFMKALVMSNLDVAWRVVHPRMPINPGIVAIRTRLATPLGRLLLANSITLTPGTITVETKGDTFFIHWINVSERDVEAATKAIVGGFEKRLEVFCG
ncbi:MAG TPA: Na+/H+ antiporter subunit E [Spirochaetales bacterium]|nr:Na+/H+ antiporter subunit E [Spirochaetales bacterium]